MASMLERVNQKALELRTPKRSISTLEEYAAAKSLFNFQGYDYGAFSSAIKQTLAGELAEQIPTNLTAYAEKIYASNGPVFALMAIRMMCFSAVRFQWQQMLGGRPGKLFGNTGLRTLERPWPGGTTQDLLTKMISDADLAGNAYFTAVEDEIVHLRPDWVAILLEPRIPDPRKPRQILGYRRLGYLYQENGFGADSEIIFIRPDQMVHFCPYPDPLASFRGQSWLTPVIREITNDKLMSSHQTKFFENGATPNMVISVDAAIPFEEFKRFKAEFKLKQEGIEHAYKTLFIGGGADATVVGANFEQMAFTATQGRGETRLAAAAGVPVTIVGFSEGLQGSSLNAGNFGQARRRLSDITMHPLWGNAAGCLETILRVPSDTVRLWYDSRDVPFLREDATDVAQIQQTNAATLTSLTNGGWEPESAKEFLVTGDMSVLKHTGLLSVQLQPPLTETPNPTADPVAGTGDNTNATN